MSHFYVLNLRFSTLHVAQPKFGTQRFLDFACLAMPTHRCCLPTSLACGRCGRTSSLACCHSLYVIYGQGRELLEKGYICHPWLPRSSNFQPFSSPCMALDNLDSVLMNAYNEWNEILLKQIWFRVMWKQSLQFLQVDETGLGPLGL